ncbi:hypothetical protein ACS0TY_011311 [Phlomoides rotata]
MLTAIDKGSYVGSGTPSNTASSASTPIDSSNIGFQLLKKHGWKEGTGLGVSEQGRLEPIQTSVKKNKRGLGAEKPKKAVKQSKISDEDNSELPKEKPKRISKKMRKNQEIEKRIEETEFDRAFFRMFWPDNV